MSPRDRNTLFGGVLAMISILAGARGVPLWRAWDEQARLTADEATGEVAAIEAQLVRLPALRDSARARSVRATAARARLITAPTVQVAGAALETRVTDIADDLGISVTTV